MASNANRRWVALLTFVTVSAAAPGFARAAGCAGGYDASCLDVDGLWPSASGPFLSFGARRGPPPGKVAAALSVGYVGRPLSLALPSASLGGSTFHAVEGAVDATLGLAFGVTDRLSFELAAPLTLYQFGAGLGPVFDTSTALPRSTLRDLRLGLRHDFIARARTADAEGLAVSASLTFALPTAPADSFAGWRTMTAAPTVTVGYRRGGLEVAGSLGARVRGRHEFGDVAFGTQLVAMLGFAYHPLPRGLLSVALEAYAMPVLVGQPTLASTGSARPIPVPAEWMATVSTTPLLGGDLGFALAGGSALPLGAEIAPTTPAFRVTAALRYAPQ